MNIAVIPARYVSTRFPGKPLAHISGHTMIWHVYQRCLKAKSIDAVWVATDDERILREVKGWGGKVMMTRSDHPSGTDRVAEVASKIDVDIVVNVQGDEPLMDPLIIDAVVKPLLLLPDIQISTPVTRVKSAEELFDPTMAKVTRDKSGFALYFSRAPIPFIRDHGVFANYPYQMEEKDINLTGTPLFRHIGLYAYRRETLFKFCKLSPSPLELAEKLEQLRALENGIPILTVEVDYEGIGVDTPEDLKKVERLMRSEVERRRVKDEAKGLTSLNQT